MRLSKKLYLLFILFLPFIGKTQQGDYFLGFRQYPFIKYNENRFVSPSDSNYLEGLYDKFDQIINFGEGKINIVHIGGSHIQADIYTNQIRRRLQSLQYDMNGGRGMVFPFRIAKTNNPSNYKVSYSGKWKYCKNTQYKRSCPLGLSGIAVTAQSNSAAIQINPNPDSTNTYFFSRIKLFHSNSSYQISIMAGNEQYYGTYDSLMGYSVFDVPESNMLELRFARQDSIPDQLTIYGISLENDDPGIVYHAIGVNGAKLKSYLDCEYYSQHITALNPDLVIFSIGTNDGNTKYFNAEKYYEEYDRLIEITKVAAPNAYIMITVPNDCYMQKRYVNQNTKKLREEIYSLAKTKNYAIWDFYEIMGGLDSSKEWYRYDLMRYDRIHFNRQGYLLKGDLFISALLHGWERNLASRSVNFKPKNLTLSAENQSSQEFSE